MCKQKEKPELETYYGTVKLILMYMFYIGANNPKLWIDPIWLINLR